MLIVQISHREFGRLQKEILAGVFPDSNIYGDLATVCRKTILTLLIVQRISLINSIIDSIVRLNAIVG